MVPHCYINATGHPVDLSLPEHQVADICYHLFVHAAEQVSSLPTPGKQLGLKKGLKAFGTCGSDALLKEMMQFHMLN